MHILLVAQSLSGKDGWSRYARDLSRAFAEKGHRVSVLVHTTVDDAPWCRQYVGLRPPLHSLGFAGSIVQWWTMWQTVRSLHPDVMHVVCEPYVLPASYVPRGNCTLALTLHGSYAVLPFVAGTFAKHATKHAYKTADRIVSVSQFTKDYLRRAQASFYEHAKLEQKIRVIPNGIWIDGAPQRTPSQASPRRILGVGAVKNRKGYLQAIRALGAYKRKENTPFLYDIVGSLGDEAYVRTLRAEIDTQHLTNCVRLRGTLPQAELDALYEKSDAFLLLSIDDGMYVEGFVLTFLEAALRGVPCIGPNSGGCPEAIDNGKSGFVCDPENAEQAADCVSQVLDHDAINRTDCVAWAIAHDIRIGAAAMEQLYA